MVVFDGTFIDQKWMLKEDIEKIFIMICNKFTVFLVDFIPFKMGCRKQYPGREIDKIGDFEFQQVLSYSKAIEKYENGNF